MIIDAHAHIKKDCDQNNVNYFGIDDLLDLMNINSIEKTILLQNPSIGIINDEIKKAITYYSKRFIGTIQVYPWIENSKKIIDRYFSEKQNILKFEMSKQWGLTSLKPDFSLNDKNAIEIFEHIKNKDCQVIIDPGPIGNIGYQINEIENLVINYPNTNFLLEHLGYYMTNTYGLARAKIQWRKMIELGKYKNVWLGTSCVPNLIADSYPYIKTIDIIKEAKEIIGVDKLVWGSDVPGSLSSLEYEEMINIIKNSKSLTDGEKQKIMYFNAKEIFSALN